MALSRPLCLLFTAAAVFAATCDCSGVGHMPSNGEEAGDFEVFKVRTGQAGDKDKAAESWTGWAKEKLSEGLGLNYDHDAKGTSKRAFEKAGDIAKTAKDRVEDMASGKR